MDLRFEFTGTDHLIAYLRGYADAATTRVNGVIADMTKKIRDRVYQKLSGPVLAAKSGYLRDHLQMDVATNSSGSTGRVLIRGVVYAAIQEYGGRTKPHDIRPKYGKVLAFMVGGKAPIGKSSSSAMVYAQVVHHPGSVMPERSYMRSSLADNRMELIDRIRGAVAGNA
jgi:phage gpG-like protein